MAKPHTAISEEEFIAWRDDPVTRWVFAGCANYAEGNKRAWTEHSFSTGIADQDFLIECRTRADAYRALADTDFQGWRIANGEEE